MTHRDQESMSIQPRVTRPSDEKDYDSPVRFTGHGK